MNEAKSVEQDHLRVSLKLTANRNTHTKCITHSISFKPHLLLTYPNEMKKLIVPYCFCTEISASLSLSDT